MRAAEAGRARGLPIFTEVRFLYLHLTKERFDQPDGAIYTGDPPLREKSDANYLWSAIAKGAGDVVDTDHVGLTREDKLDPSLNIINHRPAGNYLQVDLPLNRPRAVGPNRSLRTRSPTQLDRDRQSGLYKLIKLDGAGTPSPLRRSSRDAGESRSSPIHRSREGLWPQTSLSCAALP